MTVGSADVHKAAVSLWESSGLDTEFKSYWAVADRTRYMTLNDAEAAPGTPFPYAVFSAPQPSIRVRMTGRDGKKYHVNDQPWTFDVYAAETATKSAKEMASYLADEILKVFGGHPNEVPETADMELDHGAVLIVQYENDYEARQPRAENGDVYQWTITYNIRTDVPVAV